MNTTPVSRSRAFFRAIGSLWFAAVLLVLLLVAMACATVFESMQSTDQALAMFYKAWWFEWLLVLLAVNVATAVVVRYPFSKRQIGFVLTHTGILLTLGGALVTKHFGINGQLGLAEGQTLGTLRVPEPTLILANRASRAQVAINLKPSLFDGFSAVDHPRTEPLMLDNINVAVTRYAPDSEVFEEVVDGDPRGRLAVEVSLSPPGHAHPVWLFAGQTDRVGGRSASLRVIESPTDLARLLAGEEATASTSDGGIKVEFQSRSFEVPLKEGLSAAVPLGDTGYSIRALRYLPHATVGPDNEVVNTSDRPVNPAIEVEVTGPEGTEKRLAFARFPDFQSMHGNKHTEAIKVTFVAPTDASPATPMEVLCGPDQELYVRFQEPGEPAKVHPLTVGAAVESPWTGLEFTVLRRFDGARLTRAIQPVDPVRETRTPAIELSIRTDTDTSTLWVQKYSPRPITIDGTVYDLVFADKVIDLGFSVRLDRFHVGRYPGETRPRSFESTITILDPITGGEQHQVVSMNHPVKHGGYSFYQSSYRMGRGPTLSFLSVARDPGLPIVFAGYITIMVGMVVVLATRVVDRRRLSEGAAGSRSAQKGRDRRTDRVGTNKQQNANRREASGVAAPHGAPADVAR